MAATTPLRRILSALAFLPLIASLTLSSPAVSALTSTARSQDSRGSFTIDITINKDDTYDYKVSVAKYEKDSSVSSEDLKESCEDSSGSGAWDKAKPTYSEPNGRPTCTYSGRDKISESGELIEHTGDEYVFDTWRGAMSSADDDLDYSLSVTFPGKVTKSAGGKVSGTTVTFNEAGDYQVTGKDTPAFPWVWVIIGVLVVAAAGGGTFWYLSNRRKRAQQQMYQAYPAGVAGYATGQQQPPAPGQGQAPGPVPPSPQGAVDPGYPQQEHGGAVNPGPVPPSDNQPNPPTSH